MSKAKRRPMPPRLPIEVDVGWASVLLDGLLEHRTADLPRAEYRLYRGIAVQRINDARPAKRRVRLTGWRRDGIIIRPDRYAHESHYHCLFCDANLATLGWRGGRMITQEFLTRLERHVFECALRYLMTGEDPR